MYIYHILDLDVELERDSMRLTFEEVHRGFSVLLLEAGDWDPDWIYEPCSAGGRTEREISWATGLPKR